MATTEQDLAARGITIVAARDGHAAGLAELIAAIFAEYEGVVFSLDEMPELQHVASAFAGQGGEFWCAFRGHRLVGCCGWTPSADGEGVELKKLYVARDERRHKLGHLLTRRVEEAARARGSRFVELWSDVKFTAAHRFYEARGYRRDGRTRALGDLSDTVEYYFRRTLAPAPPRDHD